MNTYAEIERLADQVRAGRFAALDEILVLCQAYMDPSYVCVAPEFGLSPTEGRIFELLRSKRGKFVHREALAMACMCGTRDREPPSDETLGVHVFRLRHKLAKSGYRIETRQGYGYCLAA